MIEMTDEDAEFVRQSLAAFEDNTSVDYDSVTKITEDLRRARQILDTALLG